MICNRPVNASWQRKSFSTLTISTAEYWAQGVAAYFDSTGQAAAPEDAPHPISTREALQAYDPGLFALVRETMAYGGKVDWRFRPYPCP